MIGNKFFLGCALVLLVLSSSNAFAAPNVVIANSQDWRDVYSTQLYANLIGAKPFFLVSMRHSQLLLFGLPRTEADEALIISSSRLPYVLNYKKSVEAIGLKAEELSLYSANLELANRLDVNNFVIIDDSYGYNAVSVAPYAIVKKAYVLFADANNIDDVTRFLSGRSVGEVVIYGIVDRDVVQSLDGFNPVIINKGDKFSDNVEIVKKYQEIAHAKQAVLTNGDFIEKEIMSGEEPVVFIGRNNVPDVVNAYIKDSEIEIGVLIGNELVSTATFVRRQLGISVFVKFAQGARAPTGPISQVEALDMFYLPRVVVEIDISSIVYNTATGLLEITYQNLRDVAAFVKGTFTITTDTGQRLVVGDDEPIFLDPGGSITITKNPGERIVGSEISARAFVIFGEAPNSLEFTLDKTLKVSQVSVLDSAKVNITAIYYDEARKEFVVELENIGSVNAYVDIELRDLKIGYQVKNYGLDGVGLLAPGEKKRFRISVDEGLLPEDIAKNQIVKVRVFYGEREGSLVNVIDAELTLQTMGPSVFVWVIIGAAGLLILLILLKLRVKCDNCRHRNFIWRSRCTKCRHKL